MRLLAVMLATALMIVSGLGCGGGGGSHSDDCLDICDFCTSNSQCCPGLNCLPFTDGTNRCSRLGQVCP